MILSSRTGILSDVTGARQEVIVGTQPPLRVREYDLDLMRAVIPYL